MKKSLLTLVFLAATALIWFNWSCLVFRFSAPPDWFAEQLATLQADRVLVAFGDICTTCPSGEVMETLNDQNLLIVFERGTSNGDIERFMEAFQPIGYPYIDDGSLQHFFEKMAACRNDERWRYNYYLETADNGEIIDIRRF